MPEKQWKQLERRIAKFFHTYRTPLSGGNSRITESDTLHNKFFLEIKSRKALPFLKLFREEIMPKAKKEKKIPILVIHETKHSDDLCFIRLKDLKSFVLTFIEEIKNGATC